MGAWAARSTRAGRLASDISARRFCATTCFRRCAFLPRFSAMFVAMAHSQSDSEFLHYTSKVPLGGVAARQIFWGQGSDRNCNGGAPAWRITMISTNFSPVP